MIRSVISIFSLPLRDQALRLSFDDALLFPLFGPAPTTTFSPTPLELVDKPFESTTTHRESRKSRGSVVWPLMELLISFVVLSPSRSCHSSHPFRTHPDPSLSCSPSGRSKCQPVGLLRRCRRQEGSFSSFPPCRFELPTPQRSQILSRADSYFIRAFIVPLRPSLPLQRHREHRLKLDASLPRTSSNPLLFFPRSLSLIYHCTSVLGIS